MRERFLLASMLCLLGATATAEAASPAQPQVVLEDYVVKPGDTCVSISREQLGGSKGLEILHKYNELGATPHHLKPGQILRLPAPPSEGADAELSLVRNLVETYTPDRRPGTLHEKLHRGHKVGTEEQSAAELTFVDTSRLRLSENTLIVVLGQTRAAGLPAPRSETTLVTGSLRAHMAALAGGAATGTGVAPLVRTEGSEVELGAGESKVSFDSVKTTRLAVYHGRSKLRAMKKTVEVAEGFGSSAKNGEPPTPPRRLPAAPAWTQGLPERVLVDATADVAASYQPGKGEDVPQPAAYHVQLARDDEFRDIITDARVGASVLNLEAKALAPGKYFARVAAIDADEFEGLWGEVSSTTVELKPPPPVAPAPPPPPPAPTPPPPPSPAPRRIFGGLGVLLGGGLVTQNNVVGPKCGLEIEGFYQLTPHVALAAGLRGGVEFYNGATTDNASVTVKRRALGLGLALSLRYRIESAWGLTPFVGVLSEVLFLRLIYDGADATRDWFSTIGPLAGLALPVGHGAAFIEGSWRTPTSYPYGPHENAPVSAVNLLAGYRVRF
jgi:hypothetical protein